MITDNRINRFVIQWTDICRHTYERASRTKWRITMDYVCGAHMTLADMPDDLIQCLVRGALNSRIPVETNMGVLDLPQEEAMSVTWVEIHGWLFEREGQPR